MNSFIKTNKNLITYSLIFLIVVPIFGFNFLISFISNILILLFLIPLLLILIAFISFNTLKSKINICSNCGTVSFGSSTTCVGCGTKLNDINISGGKTKNNPNERIIEVKAEEIQ